MANNKIISIKSTKSKAQVESLTIHTVKEELDAFRANKKKQTDKIPKEIWIKVGDLLRTYPESEVLKTLNITNIQLENAKKLVKSVDNLPIDTTTKTEEKISFCKVQEQEKTTYPLDYKPAQAFTTKTSIVELYRPDGMLMKIHICTDRFEELLSAFFKWNLHDCNNPRP